MKMGLRIDHYDPGYQELCIQRTNALRKLVNGALFLYQVEMVVCQAAGLEGEEEDDLFLPLGVNATVFVALRSAKSGLRFALHFRVQHPYFAAWLPAPPNNFTRHHTGSKLPGNAAAVFGFDILLLTHSANSRSERWKLKFV